MFFIRVNPRVSAAKYFVSWFKYYIQTSPEIIESIKIISRIFKFTIIALFFTIVILPVCRMYLFSFVKDSRFSLAHYTSILSDFRQIVLLFKSLGLAGFATFLSLAVGVPFAFLLARTDVLGKRMWKVLFLLPLCLPAYIQTLSWIYLLGSKGVVNVWLMDLFGLSSPVIRIYGFWGAGFILALSYFPFVILLTLNGFGSMDRRLEEAALLNQGPVRVYLKIVLPLLFPFVFSGAVFVFIFSLFNYGVPALLQVHTYPVEIFTQFSAFYNEGAATALSFPLVLVALALVWFQRYLMGTASYVTVDTGSKKKRDINLGLYQKYALCFIISIIVIAVVIPVVVLAVKAGGPAGYRAAFKTSFNEVIQTLILSLVSAGFMAGLAYALSRMIEDKKFKYHRGIDYLTFIPFALPATVLGIGLIYFWNRPLTEAVYTGSGILIMAHTARFIPFTIRVLNPGFKQINTNIREAALLTENPWWTRLFRIELPLMIQGLGIGWTIAFILCMGELGATLLVIPPGKGTISLKIYTLMHYGANQITAVLSLALISINLIVAIIALSLFRKTGRR